MFANFIDKLIELYRELSEEAVIGIFLLTFVFGLFVAILGEVVIRDQLHHRNLMECVDKTHDLAGCEKALK